MKLAHCPHCWDVFKITRAEERRCKCGRTRARCREDGQHVDVSEGTIVLGLSNTGLRMADARYLTKGTGTEIPCSTFEAGYHRVHIMRSEEGDLSGEMIEL